MRIYHLLSHLFPRSYTAKVLAVAAAGALVPLAVVVLWALAQDGPVAQHSGLVGWAFGATMLGMLATFPLLRALLAPLWLVEGAMRQFEESGKTMFLPARYGDDAGRLMERTNRLIGRVAYHVDRSRREAEMDHLTGIPNRRGFEAMMAGISSQAGALLLADIDRFKVVNDRLGHQEGDRILVEVAAAIRGALRQGDLIARLGGEEFAVYLPGITPDGAEAAAERLRVAVEMQVRAASEPVTISIGMALPGGPLATMEERLDLADRNLYVAKASGRNCVIWGPAAAVA